jgi:hypothetical protein
VKNPVLKTNHPFGKNGPFLPLLCPEKITTLGIDSWVVQAVSMKGTKYLANNADQNPWEPYLHTVTNLIANGYHWTFDTESEAHAEAYMYYEDYHGSPYPYHAEWSACHAHSNIKNIVQSPSRDQIESEVMEFE